MTRTEILSLKVGDVVQQHINGHAWPAAPITAITARGFTADCHPQGGGRAFVCFYQQFGENSQISGSCGEDESLYTLVQSA